MHKNPAYWHIKQSLSLCLWIPNTTPPCWLVLYIQAVLTGRVSGEGSTSKLERRVLAAGLSTSEFGRRMILELRSYSTWIPGYAFVKMPTGSSLDR